MSLYIYQKYWYQINFDMVWEKYPDTIFDSGSASWFQIPAFPLSDNWWQFNTNLLVMLPGLNGDIKLSKPDAFYLDLGLRTIKGNTPKHIFENNNFNDRYINNWARYSFHLKEWNPSPDVHSGDTLLTLLDALTIGLFILADEADNGK